ncbi:MAG: radical SAM protein [Lachnospiraceae bacterium]|nr:radical SAM protein [Lachnospiraceae bacterium]
MSKIDILYINAPSAYPGSMLSHRIQGLPPLGLGYLATYIRQFGYTSKILDFYIRSVTLVELYKILQEETPKTVGISTTTETYKCGLRIASIIRKKYPDIPILMGGCHVTFEYADALNSGVVDYVIRNEGEITTKELLDYLLKNIGKIDDIDGICYKSSQGKIIRNRNRKYISDLDSLPIPDRTLFDLKSYTFPASISTSRGCPGNCIFCAATALSGGCYRIRSAQNILKEFIYLKSLGYNHINIVDDTMTADIHRLNEFLDTLLNQNLNMTWNCESRVDIMTKNLLQKMKKAGCISIQFGVEAGSQEMLDCLKKNVTMDQIRNVFSWSRELNITTATCLIIGQPFDTKETIKNTIDFALELQNLGARVVFSVSTPYPGTYMYTNPDKLGLTIKDKDFDNYNTQTPVYDSLNLTMEEIRNAFFDAFVTLGKGHMNDNTRNVLQKVRHELKSEILRGNKYD